ncbi:MAG: nitrous oxide reductase family maturation protein NosD [Gemmatimonadetes bacterium]|nr:nitrous oxide reductase family maturation protein NosD [Gemmatimonadota bacterium]
MILPLLAGALLLGAPRTIRVAPGTALPTISTALGVAADGDTIRVGPGEYREPELVIARRLTLLGEGWPVLVGGDHQILTVTADDVTIAGFVLREVSPSATDDRAAIKVRDAGRCRIENNTLIDTFFGIYLSRAAGCVVRGNRIRGSGTTEALSGNAIHSWSSNDLRIEGNLVRGHRDGIYLEFTTGAVVRDNTSSGNLRYGLHFMFSNQCEYTDNHFLANGAGVAVMYSHHVLMERNTFAESWGSGAYGVLLKDISDSRLTGNRFDRNSTGLFGEGTNRVEVTGNEFTRNGWGVRIMADAHETAFTGNRFSGNSFDVSSNSANAASRFRGNYWDRYAGYDLDRDGYGDVPFAPVRLFALVVQQNEPALILLRSFFVSLLDLAERVAPVLTPRMMEDPRPLMQWPAVAP